MPRNPQELTLVVVSSAAIAFNLALLGYVIAQGAAASPFVGAFAAGALTGFVAMAWRRRAIDPWRMQARLMRISGQPTPRVVQLNKHSFTYIAMCMEELAETIAAVVAPLQRVHDQYVSATTGGGAAPPAVMTFPDGVISPVGMWLADSQRWLARSSLALRSGAKRVPDDFWLPLQEQEAVNLADGCTDLSVVSCGLSIVTGVPGAPCYEEVVGSNLSKANPETGVIDKDASGKWIKGLAYESPSLADALADFRGNP